MEWPDSANNVAGKAGWDPHADQLNVACLRNLPAEDRDIETGSDEFGFRLLQINNVHVIDPAVEWKRCLIVIVDGHRRAEVGADVEAVVGGEPQWRADRHRALGNFLTVHRQGDFQWTSSLLHRILGDYFDLDLADG